MVVVEGLEMKGGGKTYLRIKGCEELTEEEEEIARGKGLYLSGVKIKRFEQVVEICKKAENDAKVLLTTITTVDFGGYCSSNDNLNMALLVLDKMSNFYNFI